MKFITLLILTPFLALNAVADDTPDGTIPNKNLATMEAYVGTYTGKFDGRRGAITVALEGNRPVVSFEANDGSTDLVGESCGSSIGQLTNIDFDQKSTGEEVDYAVFEFSPGSCLMIRGRTLTLDFGNKKGVPYKLNASVYYETRWEYDHPGFCDPIKGCWGGNQRPVDHYLYGSFKR